MKKRQFEELCQAYYEKIYQYVWVSTKNKEQTEDIVQDVFVIAYQKGNDFLQHEKPLAFLYTTARNLVYESFRQQNKCIPMEIFEHTLVSPEEDVVEYIWKKENQNVNVEPYAREIIRSLSEEKQQLYTLYYVEHKTMKEIARLYHTSEVTIRMRYVRLRKEIKTLAKKIVTL